MRIGISCVKYGLGQSGGVQIYLREFLAALASHDLTDNQYVLLVPPGTAVPPEADNPRFSVFRLKPPPEPSLPIRAIKRLLRRVGIRDFLPPYAGEIIATRIADLKLDIVHFPATTIDIPYPLPSGQKVVLTFFDMQQEFYPQFFSDEELARRALIYRSSVDRSQVVIAPTIFTAQSLQEKYGVPLDRLRVVYCGVSERFMQVKNPAMLESVRARYGLPTKFLFYPANPWPHKNHLRLLQALNLMREKHGVECALVTTGRVSQEKVSVQELAAQAGYPSHLVYDLGFVPETDMPALYSLARLMVFPSLFEGFGIPILEAMASGCPVVCSNTTSLPELGGNAVRYTDPSSVESIAEGIFEVWNNHEQRAALVSRGLECVKKFSWQKAVQQTLAVYEETAHG